MERRTAVILAGGRSSRFGCNKAWAPFRGRPLLTHLTERLAECHFDIILSGPKTLSALGRVVIEDHEPFAGPLSALVSVWKTIAARRILLVACDMPFLSSSIIEDLWETGLTCDLAVLSGANGPSPLPGVYSDLLRPVLSRLHFQGRRDLKALFEEPIHVKTLKERNNTALFNMNTPADMAYAALL